MKRLSLLILSLIILDVSWALSPTMLDISTHSSGEVSCDDCSGALKFAWHMEDNDSTPDVTLGNPCGCSDGDSIGAESGAPVFSNVQKSDGTYSLHINAKDEWYEFVVSGDDLVENDNVKITFDIYIVSFPAGAGTKHEIIRLPYDANNVVSIQIDDSGDLLSYYRGTSVTDYINISPATGSWLSCEYQAKTGVAGNDHYLACGASSTEEDDDLTAMEGSATNLNFGDEFGTEAGEYYLDNVKISACDRY